MQNGYQRMNSFPSIKPRQFGNDYRSRMEPLTTLAAYFPNIKTKDDHLQKSLSVILPDISRKLVHVNGYMSRITDCP